MPQQNANHVSRRAVLGATAATVVTGAAPSLVQADGHEKNKKATPVTQAIIDGTGHGWRDLTKEDFTKCNSADDTWMWDGNNVSCTGRPVSVIRSVRQYTNFEMTVQWMHLRAAGNSGVFLWATPQSIENLTKAGKPGLPAGIEVQVLDLMYGQPNPADWYTSHGDVFPTGGCKMKPFPPVAPNGKRSFPSKNLTRGINEWNHYYIRAINGEVRLWVNGEEVSGGTDCQPSTGYLCLESEGSPIEFKNLRIRELP